MQTYQFQENNPLMEVQETIFFGDPLKPFKDLYYPEAIAYASM